MHASAQPTPPDIPDQLKPPAGVQLALKVHATGSQIYICQQNADGTSAWTLKAPDAELTDDNGKVIGHHFGGPTWKHEDGSQITAKMGAKVDSPDPQSIPWLLLNVTGNSGEGVLSRVTAIQRTNTHGGQPPAGACDSAKQGTEIRVPYRADYFFYAPR
jgi:hypothetical protein